jgi:hypothetical protein
VRGDACADDDSACVRGDDAAAERADDSSIDASRLDSDDIADAMDSRVLLMAASDALCDGAGDGTVCCSPGSMSGFSALGGYFFSSAAYARGRQHTTDR